MGTSRKIPMHRAGSSRGSSARPVPHPGVNGADRNTPTFISPFQPPTGHHDLAADLDPGGWKNVTVAGYPFRVKTPQPQAVSVLSFAWSQHQRNTAIAHETMVDFVTHHTHPDDLGAVLPRMADPDDESFGMDEFTELVKQIVTVGTARPFLPWLALSTPRRTRGG